ncbi:hypothetical protein AB0L49_49795 [Streptomyces antimycoticus]|uniref:hypothetical protein n=1 Tax=Streptomyces antimycoticus TaxID=68175 RepID=UPI00341E5F54
MRRDVPRKRAENMTVRLGPILTVALVLAALNLRPAITSLGALLEEDCWKRYGTGST